MNRLTNQSTKKIRASIVYNVDDSETSSGGSGTGTKGTKPKDPRNIMLFQLHF